MGRGLAWRLPAAAVVVLVFGFAVTALGYFVAVGAGAGRAQVDALSAPAISGATAGAGTVALSWSSVPPPDGTGAVTYHVSRDGSAPGGNCPSSAAPTTATSCTDSGLVAGTYHYTVTAHWRTWTATSSTATVTVASGPASRLALNAAATTVTAGQTDNLTILAQDASGNTVTAYSGNKSLTFTGAGTVGSNNPTVTDSGGVARNFGTPETISFSAGAANVSGGANGVMRLYKAETASVVVSDGTISNGSGLSITVNPAAAAKLAFTQQPSNSTGGVAFATQPRVGIQDQFGNAVTTDTSNVTLAIGTNPAGGNAHRAAPTHSRRAPASRASPAARSTRPGPATRLRRPTEHSRRRPAARSTSPSGPPPNSPSSSNRRGHSGRRLYDPAPGRCSGRRWQRGHHQHQQRDPGDRHEPRRRNAYVQRQPTGGELRRGKLRRLQDRQGRHGYTLTATDGSLSSATSAGFNVVAQPLWVATGATVTRTNNGNLAPAIPASLSVNDLMLLIVANTTSSTSAAPTGWTSVGTIGSATGAGVSVSVFRRFFQTGDTAPSVAVTADAGGASAQIVAYRYVNTTSPLDVAGGDQHLGGRTDDLHAHRTDHGDGQRTSGGGRRRERRGNTAPTLSFSNAQGFSAESGFPNAPAVGNGSNHHAVDLASKPIPSPLSVTFPTFSTNLSGIWAGLSLALRP